MHKEKRTYDAEDGTKKFPRISSRPSRQEAAEASARLVVDQIKNATPRELVLRLIDWVKQI